jgi:hypothetical protein
MAAAPVDVTQVANLQRSGTTCHVGVIEGAFHAFDMMLPNSRPALRFPANQCDFLRRTLPC